MWIADMLVHQQKMAYTNQQRTFVHRHLTILYNVYRRCTVLTTLLLLFLVERKKVFLK